MSFPLIYIPHGKTQPIKSEVRSPTAQGPDQHIKKKGKYKKLERFIGMYLNNYLCINKYKIITKGKINDSRLIIRSFFLNIC